MAVWPLHIIYPTCKRWTNLAPIPLGFMFKVGIFMGWSDLSVDRTIPWNTLIPIYLGACLWTITYETVYQHQDKIDDLKIGIHSPALLCGEYTIPICLTTALGFLGLLWRCLLPPPHLPRLELDPPWRDTGTGAGHSPKSQFGLHNHVDEGLIYFPSLEQLLLADACHWPGCLDETEAREDNLMEAKLNRDPLPENNAINSVFTENCLDPEALVSAGPPVITSQKLSLYQTPKCQPMARTTPPSINHDIFAPPSSPLAFDTRSKFPGLRESIESGTFQSNRTTPSGIHLCNNTTTDDLTSTGSPIS
ncbi:hypothetical protein B0H10DRAFT_2226570 [Mycena sp. CBHHK59/15]|nr:hypothetical protein B0H10DRAFT_2226570 [Mycena sp. CBHHK59/15]